jgi:acyl dehydratase
VTGGTAPRAAEPGTTLPERRVHARNLFRDAANRIHDDEGARQHGYAGALVAGVTIYGYLTRLVVDRWGIEWPRRGTATVRFARPVYDGDLLTLSGRIVGRSGRPEAGEHLAEIVARSPRGEIVATMAAGLAWGGPAMWPDPRGYPTAALPAWPPPATAETLAGLHPLGAPVLLLDAPMLERAADDLDDPSPIYRGADGVAHPALVLRQANRALAENVALAPWIHVGSDVMHTGLARVVDRLETRGRVARVYERNGRGWVDLELLVVAEGTRPIARIRHTAIYRMPAPAAGEGACHE